MKRFIMLSASWSHCSDLKVYFLNPVRRFRFSIFPRYFIWALNASTSRFSSSLNWKPLLLTLCTECLSRRYLTSVRKSFSLWVKSLWSSWNSCFIWPSENAPWFAPTALFTRLRLMLLWFASMSTFIRDLLLLDMSPPNGFCIAILRAKLRSNCLF